MGKDDRGEFACDDQLAIAIIVLLIQTHRYPVNSHHAFIVSIHTIIRSRNTHHAVSSPRVDLTSSSTELDHAVQLCGASSSTGTARRRFTRNSTRMEFSYRSFHITSSGKPVIQLLMVLMWTADGLQYHCSSGPSTPA